MATTRLTEAEWNTCSDPASMLFTCRWKIIREHQRKGHLFAVACCYDIWDLLTDVKSRRAVEIAEKFADGMATESELERAAAAAQSAHAEAFESKGKVGASPEWAAEFAASTDAWFAATRASGFASSATADDSFESGREHAVQSHLLRCIFGPLPFRSVSIEPSWLQFNDGAAVKLAQAIYRDRSFDELCFLASVLEEAGCTDGDILSHCRNPGRHVRGCWVIDLLLGRK